MFCSILKSARQAKQLKLKDLAAYLKIDQALISKFESGSRMPNHEQLEKLATLLGCDFNELKTEWLAEKILHVVRYEPMAYEALIAAESRVEYLTSDRALVVPDLSEGLRMKLDQASELRNAWQELKPLDQTQLSKMKEYFNIENTFESNRIEGNTLTFQETHLVIHEGLTISGKSMKEHLEAINHVEALEFLEEIILTKDEVNRRNVLQLHQLILKGIDSKNAGVYRQVPVRIGGSKHEPPQPYLLEKLMEDFYAHYQKQRRRMHPVILAAEVHERLVTIHPFIDGNGRTSRLLMNMVLLQNGYTLTNIKGDPASRIAYYKALEEVQVNSHPEPFYELVLDSVIHSLKEHIKLAK